VSKFPGRTKKKKATGDATEWLLFVSPLAVNRAKYCVVCCGKPWFKGQTTLNKSSREVYSPLEKLSSKVGLRPILKSSIAFFRLSQYL
jgi:hypothetical protein